MCINLQTFGNVVCDENNRHVAFEAVHRGGEAFGRFLIQVCGCFIEDQYSGTFQKGPSDGYSLALAAGKPHSVLPQFRLVAPGESLDGLVDARMPAGHDNILKTGMRIGQDEIVVDGAGKEHGFLRHDAEEYAQFIGRHVADILAVDADAPVSGLPESEKKFGQGAFPAP